MDFFDMFFLIIGINIVAAIWKFGRPKKRQVEHDYTDIGDATNVVYRSPNDRY